MKGTTPRRATACHNSVTSCRRNALSGIALALFFLGLWLEPAALGGVPGEGQRSFFTWYDNVGGADWVLMANPGAAGPDSFGLTIGRQGMSLPADPGMAAGEVSPGRILTARFPGVIGGPVEVVHSSAEPPVISQRILWAGRSLEEVFAVPEEELSDHYIWSWYDMSSPGFRNWVLIGNISAEPVYYEITLAGRLLGSGSIEPGAQTARTFPGVIGGPVEARAWTGPDRAAPAMVVASQRMLVDGVSFNETPGIPFRSLSDYYLWTWYDMRSAGSRNWILLANMSPGAARYEIRIAGQAVADGWLEPGETITPIFPGLAGGPVEVQAWSDEARTRPAAILASQRSLWGQSFEEVPGSAAAGLKSEYHWTWYDMESPGMSNWVTIANPGAGQVYYEIQAGGRALLSGRLDAGEVAAPVLPGFMGGPVTVKAWADAARSTPAPVVSSQRVLYNGFFNELRGSGRNGSAGDSGGYFSVAQTGVAPMASAAPVSVRDFGAAGDGVTDDTAALQRAVASGQNVYVPEGTFRVTDTISIAGADVRISGSGEKSVIFADMDRNAIEFTGDRGYVGNLSIVGNGRPVAPVDGRTAVKFYDADGCIAENLWIRNVGTGGVGTGGGTGSRGTVIRNVYVEHVREHGIYLSTAGGAIVENVRVEGAGRNGGSAGAGLKIADSTGVRVYDFTTSNSLSAGVVAEASSDATSSAGVELVNVTSIAPAAGQYGLYLNRDVSGVLVSGGYFEGGTGIRLGGNPDDVPRSVTVTNARVTGRGQYALDAAWGNDVRLIGGTYTGPVNLP